MRLDSEGAGSRAERRGGFMEDSTQMCITAKVVGRLGVVPGIVATSGLFGAAHLIAWQGPITLAYALSVAGGGLVLGALRHLSGRLGPSTVAHALFNAEALLAVALLT